MKYATVEVIKIIHKLLKEQAWSLSIAESCTGGLISHYVTCLAGASTFFKTGIVSYSEESKINILAVSPATINTYGAVSRETAREMAEKIRFITKSDFSVSTTGNLGPEVLEGKDKGLIYIAACKEGKTVCRELRLEGSREENKEEAAISALNLLIELVEEGQ